MKRSGFKRKQPPPLQKGDFSAYKPMPRVSAKKAAYRRSKAGQDALAYMKAVKQLPCCICGAHGPSDAHHCFHDRFGTSKASDMSVIPLCKSCHQVGPLAIHNDKKAWRERNGPDHGFIASVRAKLAALGLWV